MTRKTKYINVFTLAFCSVLALNSFGQTLSWAKQIGGTGWDESTSIDVDSEGNVYTTGNFEATVDFDPGAGVVQLTSVSSDDIFISKVDAAGNFVWAKQISGNYQESNAMALDSSGNIFITGSFLGQVDFDPGAGVFNLSSTGQDRDVFILKLDSAGNFIWAKQISGQTTVLPSPTNAFSIAVDASSNVYITGYFDGTVDFDPDTATNFDLTVMAYSDIYICKLDSTGEFVWAKQMEGTEGGVGYSIAVDENENVYSTGTIGANATVDFDPGPGTYDITNNDSSNSMIYVLKLDASGNFVWANSAGTGEGSAIAVNPKGGAYASGWYPLGVTPVVNKFDSLGNLIWARELGGINGRSIVLDSNGNVYTVGSSFEGVNDYDPGPGIFNMTSGTGDAFISKLDSLGDFVWAGLIKSTSQVTINALAIDEGNSLFATGFFDGTTDFDPGAPTVNLSTPSNSYNIFVQKLSPNHDVGISENSFEAEILVHPNPSEGQFTVDMGAVYESINAVITDVTGKIVQTNSYSRGQRFEMSLEQPSGIYFLKIKTNNKTAVIRLAVE